MDSAIKDTASAESKKASDLSRLKQYTRSKQTIAYQIRTLSDFLLKHVGQREAEECRQLMAKLASDRFVLTVVGEFKRGKSSLHLPEPRRLKQANHDLWGRKVEE